MKKAFINKEPADIISTLPDSLLSHILSFLPTKYAVGTSILSKRWRYIWVPVPHLEIDESQCFRTGQISLNYEDIMSAEKAYQDKFIEFVNRVLSVDDGPCLQKFCLRLETYGICVNPLLDSWISAAVRRNVREVDIKFPDPEGYGTEVPQMIFCSEKLVRLKLYGAFFPRKNSVYLPCLKVLILLCLEYSGDDIMQKLFSGCPFLEELVIERCMCELGREQDLSVLVPSLKRLKIGSSEDFRDVYDFETRSNKLVIDAPQLEHLDLTNFLSDEILLQNLRSLTKASITVGDNVAGRAISSLILSPLSNVKSLDANWVTEVGCSKLPTFHYLTQLKLGGEGKKLLDEGNKLWSFRLLGRFLECSPNLKVLTLEGGRHGSWRSPQQVPICLLLHLSKISILHVAGEKHNLKMIRYLLGNAKVLKKMTIKCKHPDANFYKALTAIPKGSMTCQLRLLL